MPSESRLHIVGIGPGGPSRMTLAARQAICNSRFVVGYRPYVELVKPLLDGKTVYGSGMGREVERARQAVDLLDEGTVSLISSGDPNVYGMGGLAMQLASRRSDLSRVDVVPGVTSFTAACCRANLAFRDCVAAISLSDLLTPWDEIERRARLAAALGIPTALYNPKSRRRGWQLEKVLEIYEQAGRGGESVLIARNVCREDEIVRWTTVSSLVVDEALKDAIDMFTILVIAGCRRDSAVESNSSHPRQEIRQMQRSMSERGPVVETKTMPQINIIGAGPGNDSYLTAEAEETIRRSDLVLGPKRYLQHLDGIIGGEVFSGTGPCPERIARRFEMALDAELSGRFASMIVGGDPSIFSSAGRVLDLAQGKARVRLIPGVSAFSAVAARVGAPIANDFVVLSGASQSVSRLMDTGFTVFLYNIAEQEIREVLEGITDGRPCAIARDVGRDGEMIKVAPASELAPPSGEKRCTLLITPSRSSIKDGRIISSRGYESKYSMG